MSNKPEDPNGFELQEDGTVTSAGGFVMAYLDKKLEDIYYKIDELPTSYIFIKSENTGESVGMECIDKSKVLEIITGVKLS